MGDLNMGLLPTDSKASKLLQLVNEGAASAPFRIEWDRWEWPRVEEIDVRKQTQYLAPHRAKHGTRTARHPSSGDGDPRGSPGRGPGGLLHQPGCNAAHGSTDSAQGCR